MTSFDQTRPADTAGAREGTCRRRNRLDRLRALEAQLADYKHLLTEYQETYDEFGIPRDPKFSGRLDMWHIRLEGLESMCESIHSDLTELHAAIADAGDQRGTGTMVGIGE